MHWWPRQTPRMGMRGPRRRITSRPTPASSGVPGPGEMTIAAGATSSSVSTSTATLPEARTSKHTRPAPRPEPAPPPPPRLQVGPAAGHHDRADRDAGVHVAGEAHVAHGARIRATRHRLQFVDDLHRPHFRGPRDRTRRVTRLLWSAA